ncbi:probable G-protein coupled receptor 75 [Carcharodon carcharias]|uniref:probable G-protein coupled receptor 75 n=1 Tax=Carcharodon carcharias TaxID=13397 RepID=UPI001B7DDE9C|nr:probable G-protein coupled receptor 75 [Carcharodon carcharias]
MNLTRRTSVSADQSFPNSINTSAAWITGNATVADLQELIHTATLATCTLLLVLIFCLGTYGNLIVFLSFFDPAFRKFRTNFDFMILNLSFCDLFLCCVTTPMFAFILFFDSDSNVSQAFCFTFHLTSAGFIIMSLKSVAVIALHRLRMVLGQQPNTTASFPCALILTISLWTVSFTLATLATLRTYPERSRVCVPLFGCIGGDGKVILYLYVIDFAFCVGIVSVSYVMIARTLKRNVQMRKCAIITVDTSRPKALMSAGIDSIQLQPLYQNQNYNKLQHVQTHAYSKKLTHVQTSANRLQLVSSVNLSGTKDSKAVVTCVVIVLSVFICCLPLGISLIQDVLTSRSSFILNQLKLCGFTLIFFKSGLNPFIYSRNSAGLRKRILWCTQYVALGCLCCKHKTRLRAVGKGSLDVNRNKSSHHETNSAYMLSPKPQGKLVDQACGPSHSRDSMLSPKMSIGQQHYAQSNSTPINTRIEPYYSIYNSSPSQEVSTPSSLQPVNATCGFAKSQIAKHHYMAKIPDFVQEYDKTSTKQIPVPSI